METIAILSQHPGFTLSYSRVAREVGHGLARLGHRVRWLGVAADCASPRPHPDSVLLPSTETQMAVAQWLEANKPDVLLTIGDPWMFAGVPGMCRQLGVRWAAYFPLDGGPLPEAWAAWVADCDCPMVFSQYARRIVAEAGLSPPEVIPHGVDLSVFCPANKDKAKQRAGVEGFVVGVVAANQQRKNLPALLKAFARFADGRTNVQLYLHTPLHGPCWDIPQLARRFDIEPQTRATLEYNPKKGIDDRTLATLYNSFDVFALPTMGEGFGLPLVEAQACGVATIATDCSACSELLPLPEQRVAVETRLIMQRNIEQAVVCVDDLHRKLVLLHEDPLLRQQVAATGRRMVQAMTWDACAEGIAKSLQRV